MMEFEQMGILAVKSLQHIEFRNNNREDKLISRFAHKYSLMIREEM